MSEIKQQRERFDSLASEYTEKVLGNKKDTLLELDTLSSVINGDKDTFVQTANEFLITKATESYISGSLGSLLLVPKLKEYFQSDFDVLESHRKDFIALKKTLGKSLFEQKFKDLESKLSSGSVAPVMPEESSDDVVSDDSLDVADYDEVLDLASKQQKKFSDIVSAPYEKGKATTLCSATAQKNAKDIFGITIPSGNAIDAQNLDMSVASKDANGRVIDQGTIDAFISGVQSGDPFKSFPDHATVADVFVKSSSKYGHRCLAFRKAPSNEWYVLDPYRTPDNKGIKPKKLSDYMSKNQLIKANFYETTIVAVADDYESVDDRLAV